MPDCFYETQGVHDMIPVWATRTPLDALSCPYSHRDAARRQAEGPQLHRRFRSFGPNEPGARGGCGASAADRDPWSTDYWNPPATRSQHARQRILALIVAVMLAALLAHVGW